MNEHPLFLGFDRKQDSLPPATIQIQLDTLLRHFMALGSSGSGKTVLSKILVEEAVCHGIPAICLDPQGDLCSLALAADDPEKLIEKGLDPGDARIFAEMIDPVIFTPASHKGVAISADPIRIDPDKLNVSERLHAFSATATILTSLLGYDLDSDEGEGLVAVFNKAFLHWYEQDRFPKNLEMLTQYWHALDQTEMELFSRYLNERKIERAGRKLARLDVGTRRLLFHEGTPLDIDMLLGRDERSLNGRTRISIIYLNSLHSQEEKEYFVAALTQQLYGWMLDNPSKQAQALFYIDEVAPFVPPVRKPACKEILTMLFKQARKYGVCCLMATQNPADVDYRAMAQFGAWALGRLTTRQDLKKIQPTVKSLDPINTDQVMIDLPSQKSGEFLLISPDSFDSTRFLQARWLYSMHETLDEDAIKQLADERGWRERFEIQSLKSAPAPQQAAGMVPEPGAFVTTEPAAQMAHSDAGEKIAPADVLLARQTEILKEGMSMTARDYAHRVGISESSARNTLKKLVHAGLAQHFKQGRSIHYWANETGLRPDLGIYEPVTVMRSGLDQSAAHEVAHQLKDGKTLGLLGEAEEIREIRRQYKLLLRVHFHEKIKQPIWRRLFSGREFEERAESIYLHPRHLKVVVFDPKKGVNLHDRPADTASEVKDFDSLVQFERIGPDKIPFDEHEWRERADDKSVLKKIAGLYDDAKPHDVDTVFLPVWQIFFQRPGKAGARIVTIDALSGFPLEW